MRTTGLQEIQEQERVTAAILGFRNQQRLPLSECSHMPRPTPVDLGGQRQLPARNSTSGPHDLLTISWEGAKNIHYYEIQQLVLG